MESVIEVVDKGREEARQYVPVDYDRSSGKVMSLSRRGALIAEVWLETGRIVACKRALEKKGAGWEKSCSTIQRWMMREPLKSWITKKQVEKAKAIGLTDAGWTAEGVDYKDGVKKADALTAFFWKELGKKMGFYKESNAMTQINQKIEFVQADGNR